MAALNDGSSGAVAGEDAVATEPVLVKERCQGQNDAVTAAEATTQGAVAGMQALVPSIVGAIAEASPLTPNMAGSGGPAANSLAPGMQVVILGTAMSGSVGLVEEFLENKGRWKVKFASGVTKNFKAENLEAAKEPAVDMPSTGEEETIEQACDESLQGDGGKEETATAVSETADSKVRSTPFQTSAAPAHVAGSLSDVLDRIKRESAALSAAQQDNRGKQHQSQLKIAEHKESKGKKTGKIGCF
jgi:hypothetical protein